MRHRRHAAVLVVALVAAAIVVAVALAAAPTAIIGTVSAARGTAATLNGTVNPAGASSGWWNDIDIVDGGPGNDLAIADRFDVLVSIEGRRVTSR